jgi:hypothetical protein
MKFAFEGDLLRLVGVGRVPSALVEQAFREALAQPRLPAKLRVLWDLRQVPNLDLTEEDLRTLRCVAAEAELPALGARVAWLAATPVVFGIGCMFRGKASALPLEVEVFRELDAALAWLAGEEKRVASAGAATGL